jgi:hypothetical protein
MKKAASAIRSAGRGVKGAAKVLAVDMSVLEHGLRDADLRLEGWLSESQLAHLIRQAYDPIYSPGGDVEVLGTSAKLATAGPVALSEHWSYLRHDSGYSCVLWISDWPRVDVAPHFLHALIFAPDIRKSFSLLARPLGTSEALKALRKEKTQSITDAGHKAQVGQVQDLADVQEYGDLLQRARRGGRADGASGWTVRVRNARPLRRSVPGLRRRGAAARARGLLTSNHRQSNLEKGGGACHHAKIMRIYERRLSDWSCE